MSRFTFRRPKKLSKPVKVATLDQEDGSGPDRDPKDLKIHLPDGQVLPVVGPTSGEAYKRLRESEAVAREQMPKILAQLRKAWFCPQCGKIWRCRFADTTDPVTGALIPGPPLPNQTVVRPTPVFSRDIKAPTVAEEMLPSGIDIDRLRCADPKCDAPVVEWKGGNSARVVN